jgi:GNAT superfamily N-acetyltransferase
MRPFTAADIPFGMRLKDAAGWNQTPADCERLLKLNPEGCFLALADGRPAGTATSVVHGAMGFVGMVLVDPERRRMGLGTALLKRVIDHLRSCESIRLDATADGKRLYDTLGFHEEYRLERRLRAPAPAADGGVPLAARVDDLLPLDAFGHDRSALLRLLFPAGLVFAAPGGFLFTRPGTSAGFIGPWVARDARTAEALLQSALAQLGDRPLFVDVPRPNAAAVEITARAGFAPRREFIRMARGSVPYREDLARVYSTAGPELG